jgi:hypothetical protein
MVKKRGRPLGFRLSEESKRAISESKKGQRHKQETKDKISRTLTIYFRNRSPLSEEIVNEYCRADDDELCGWATEVQVALDEIEDVRTERSMINSRKIEITYGQNIEYFSHEMTPETLILLKEFCNENKLNPDDVYALIDDGG